jgi:uncharacterized protein YndB with AHSA1/START domain
MLKVSETTTIACPPAEVFAAAADPQKQLEWDPGTMRSVEKLTPGPLGRGARYRANFKGFGVVEYDYPEYEPGRRFAHHSVMMMGDMRHTFEFEAVPEGTRLTQSIVVEPKGIGRLMAPLMSRMLHNRLRVVGSELKEYLKNPPATS